MPDLKELKEKGYTAFSNLLDQVFTNRLSAAIDESYELCRGIQIANGIDEVTDGTVHHLLATGNDIYLEVLFRLINSPAYEVMRNYFGGNFIVNGFGGVINLTAKPSYVANIHRDIRFHSENIPLMLNVLIMIDDFTLDNGATYLLAGSHRSPDKPAENTFYEQADRATGKSGDLILFDSNLWHAAGLNRTDNVRRALTLTFTKPFMKQQLDYSRAIGYDRIEMMSQDMQQILGFFSRTPATLNEWYQPAEKRSYRPGQDQ